MNHHTVKPGDTLSSIAGVGLTWHDVYRANPWLTDPDQIEPGWVLHVPAPVVEEPPDDEPPAEPPADDLLDPRHDDPNQPWNGTEGYFLTPHWDKIPAGFPTVESTGVQDGVSLTPSSGTMDITTDGVVIENLDHDGRIRINADNVTIRNCRISSGSGQPGGSGVIRNYGKNLTLEFCRIRGVGAPGACVAAGDYTMRRCRITGGADGAKLQANAIIEDCYISSQYRVDGLHNDSIQCSRCPSGNSVIRRNTILGPYSMSTSAILVKPDGDTIDGLIIEDNYLSGGAYTLYTVGNGHPIRNVTVRNNTFEAGSYNNGFWSNDGGGTDGGGNVLFDPQ